MEEDGLRLGRVPVCAPGRDVRGVGDKRSPRFCGHLALNEVAKSAADPPGDPVSGDALFFLFRFKGAASWEK